MQTWIVQQKADRILLPSTLNRAMAWSLTRNWTSTIFFAFNILPLEEGTVSTPGHFQEFFRKTQLFMYPIWSSPFTSVCFSQTSPMITISILQAFLKATMPKASELCSIPQHKGNSYSSSSSAFDLDPHTTLWKLQHSLYRFNLVTTVQWSRMQEHGCSLFKKYASTFSLQ